MYQAVWNTTLAVEEKLKPGVRYGDMHKLAQLTLIKSLQGFLFRDDIDPEIILQSGIVG